MATVLANITGPHGTAMEVASGSVLSWHRKSGPQSGYLHGRAWPKINDRLANTDLFSFQNQYSLPGLPTLWVPSHSWMGQQCRSKSVLLSSRILVYPRLLFPCAMVGAEEQRGWTWTSRASFPWQDHYSKDREQLALLLALVPRLSHCSDPLRTRGQPKGLSGLCAHHVDRHNPGTEWSGSFTGNEPENNKPCCPGTASSQGQPSQAELGGY